GTPKEISQQAARAPRKQDTPKTETKNRTSPKRAIQKPVPVEGPGAMYFQPTEIKSRIALERLSRLKARAPCISEGPYTVHHVPVEGPGAMYFQPGANQKEH